MIRWFADHEFRRMWKIVVFAYFEVLSHHLASATEWIREKQQSVTRSSEIRSVKLPNARQRGIRVYSLDMFKYIWMFEGREIACHTRRHSLMNKQHKLIKCLNADVKDVATVTPHFICKKEIYFKISRRSGVLRHTVWETLVNYSSCFHNGPLASWYDSCHCHLLS
jgi:hypothetical protein